MLRSSLLAATLLAASSPVLAQPLTLTPLGTLKSGTFRGSDPRHAEINAFDPVLQRIYVVNPRDGRIDVVDARVPTALTALASIVPLTACQAALGAECPLRAGLEPNSVAVSGRWLAIAVANAPRTDHGHAVFFRLHDDGRQEFVAAVEVGAGPDMITFTADGRYALTADEGEPSGYGSPSDVDPVGTVSIIDVRYLAASGWTRHARKDRRLVRRVGFERFDAPAAREALVAAGVRVFGPGARVSQDLEPEYIATHRGTAYVSLQENNALAIIDIDAGRVERIVALGLKDHSAFRQGLDASDRDNAIDVRERPVAGMYQPDALATFTRRGQTFVIAANEGDARDYRGFAEEVRVGSNAYVLDPTRFPDAATLKLDAQLGRLTVSRATGDTDGDGDIDRIDVFGGRSISIHDARGRRLWDSGDLFERLSAYNDQVLGVNLFNTDSTANSRDNRSDNKGVEPEGVVVGRVGGRPYAFVALERDSGIVVFDLSTPAQPVLVTYVSRRELLATCSDTSDCGDLGPEGLTFVDAEASPTGLPLLIVSNEVSSTTTVWEVR